MTLLARRPNFNLAHAAVHSVIGLATSVRELERRESAALLFATQQIIDETRVDQRFTAGEIRRITNSGSGRSMSGRANTGE
jgi:hypothetical protein